MTRLALANCEAVWHTLCRASRRSGPTPPIVARSWPSGVETKAPAGIWRSWRANLVRVASASNPDGGSSREPSHSTYNALLTSKAAAPMIGLAGLLNLLEVVSRLQATQQQCACASQEAGVPCLASPPDQNQTIWPVLPPAFEGAPRQSLGPAAAGQSAPAAASARSPRRTAVTSRRHEPPRRQRGDHA